MRESMAVHIPHSVDIIKTNVIPGWDAECDLSREQSLLWHYIWKQCDKPAGGYVYDVMVYTRSKYHY